MNTVIKLISPEELPALCVSCGLFMDEWCVEFPAIYDIHRKGYLCETCAQTEAPGIFAMLKLILAGAYYVHLLITESPAADAQGEYVKVCCLKVHEQHFSNVFGQPEPDYCLTSTALQ